MGKWRTGFNSVVFENLQVTEAQILPQVEQPGTIRLQDSGRLPDIQVCEAAVMVRRFDNDLVGTDAGNFPIQAKLVLLQIAKDLDEGSRLAALSIKGQCMVVWSVGRGEGDRLVQEHAGI